MMELRASEADMGRRAGWFAAALAVAACGPGEPPPPTAEEQALAKCPKVTMDGLEGDWIRVAGDKGDHTNRLRLWKSGDSFDGVYVTGGFTKRRMKGSRRAEDHKLVEVLDGARQAAYDAGQTVKATLILRPQLMTCSVRASRGMMQMGDGQETEQAVSGVHEFLEFPADQQLTWEPCDGPLYLGKAATSAKEAQKQMDSLGYPDPNHELGNAIPVGTWSDATADGDPTCTYDMDLFFDDQPVEGKQKLPAGESKGGKRHWLVDAWAAPYSGVHHFEMYRYRTCADGQRTRIGVSCLEALLQ
jgi:hypothetical protein